MIPRESTCKTLFQNTRSGAIFPHFSKKIRKTPSKGLGVLCAPTPFSHIFKISVSSLVGLWWCTLNEFFVEKQAYFLITDTKFEEKQLSKWLVFITIVKFRYYLVCLKKIRWSYHLENFEFWNNHSNLFLNSCQSYFI